MSFLHSEFLFWLLVPTLLLFYFWLTQKPLHHRWLDETMLERLKAPENTMNLKGRNTLFLIASILLIIAMAQPVIVNSAPIRGGVLHIVIAVQTGGNVRMIEKNRSLALRSLYTVLGEEIELIAYDHNLYSVAPRSNDGGILAELIRNLTPSAQSASDTVVTQKLLHYDADMKIIVSSGNAAAEGILRVSKESDTEKIHEVLNALRDAHRLQAYIPLFYYPLGLAMVLILFALSSMSRRQSVSVAGVMAILTFFPHPSEAGIFDFQLLSEAKRAYEEGNYPQSERLYARYQMEHDSPEVRYNRANALYMSGRFERAAYWYGRVYTTNAALLEKTRHNLEKTNLRIQAEKRGEKTENKEPLNHAAGKMSRSPAQNRKKTRLFTFE